MATKLSEGQQREMKVLCALADAYDRFYDFSYLPFDAIASETSLDRKQVRRACRSLLRKGLAEYARGLWTEDERPAGSGYCVTPEGIDRVNEYLVEQAEG